MITYSSKTRLAAAHSVLAAQTYEAQKGALDHWNVLIDHDMPPCPWLAPEGEVIHVDTCYGTLQSAARDYLLEHRFLDLTARIEALEAPDAQPVSDHR